MPKRSTEFDLIVRVAKALDEAAISYMMIGGQAVAHFGEPRLTRDVDFTLGVAPDRYQDVAAVAKRLKLTPVTTERSAEDMARNFLLFPVFDRESQMRVDFIFSLLPFEREAIERARKIKIQRYPVRIATPEDLVILKAIAGRPQDFADIQGLCVHNPKLDLPYIRRWLAAYSQDLAEPFLQRFEEILLRVQQGLRR